eukprot:jgi/Chlat1/6405/Chrsp45S00459
MDVDAIAKAFVEHYYSTFDGNRPNLQALYQEHSMLTFEGEKFQGPAAIAAKLTGLPFKQSRHTISTIDSQPSGPQGGLLVFVSGNLLVFHLMPAQGGSYFVFNDMFRLNYA